MKLQLFQCHGKLDLERAPKSPRDDGETEEKGGAPAQQGHTAGDPRFANESVPMFYSHPSQPS